MTSIVLWRFSAKPNKRTAHSMVCLASRKVDVWRIWPCCCNSAARSHYSPLRRTLAFPFVPTQPTPGHEDLVRSCTANPLDLASLIIYGGSDTEVPPALTEELAATLDPARQATIFFPDGGHRIPKFNEEQTSALRAFLETQQQSIQEHRKEKE